MAHEDIVDAVFAITCRCLPVDHAYALSRAVQAALPWLAEEPGAGVHTIHGAASASGWMRPEQPGELLQLSHRAKLALRLPRERLQDAAALTGSTLDIAGWPLDVGALSARPLSRITTLFARTVTFAGAETETDFLAAAERELGELGIRAKTLLCGRITALATPDRTYRARSLMLAGLAMEQSLELQRRGLGEARKLGCGLFLPHKDVGDLRSRED